MAQTKRRPKGSGTITDHPFPKFKGEQLGIVRWGSERTKKTFRGTKRQVEDQLRDFLVQLKTEGAPASGSVRDFLESWWAASQANYARSTRALYQSTMDTHVYTDAVFCKLPVAELGPDEVIKFFNRRETDGATKHTRGRIYRTLHAAFQTGVEMRKFRHNPITLPKMMKPTKGRKQSVEAFLPLDELRIIKHVQQDGGFWEGLVLLALDAGMREAEILGLQRSSFDFENRRIHVRHVLNTVGKELHLEPVPKTSSSYRTIRIARSTAEALKRFLGQSKAVSGYVFLDEDGEPFTRSQFYKQWLKVLDRAGIRAYKFHCARHTMATRLLRNRESLRSVSRRLGHAKPSITLDVYADWIPEDDDALADSFDRYVGPSSEVVRDNGPQNGPQEDSQAA